MSTIGWIIVAIIWISLAFWPARVASRKGHSFFGYFVFSLFFFPLAPADGEHLPGPHGPRSGLIHEVLFSFAPAVALQHRQTSGARLCLTS